VIYATTRNLKKPVIIPTAMRTFNYPSNLSQVNDPSNMEAGVSDERRKSFILDRIEACKDIHYDVEQSRVDNEGSLSSHKKGTERGNRASIVHITLEHRQDVI